MFAVLPVEILSSISRKSGEVAVRALCMNHVTDCVYLDHYLAFNIIMLQPDLIMCSLVVK